MGHYASTSALVAAPSFLILLALVPPAQAGHHRWDFTEAFSNGDGSVQFVELFSANTGESAVNNWTIVSDSGGSFTFVGNLPGDSQNTWVLVGTTGYALAAIEDGAPAPDYILPNGFFDPVGDTLRYAGSADTWVVANVPTDGVNSLDRASGIGVNSPTNFPGATGSIDVTPVVPAHLPSLSRIGIVMLVGVLLIAASGMIKSSRGAAPA